MTALSRIGLGTAQFGSSYGISNRQGRPGEAEVAGILARAVESGVGFLDTAFAYGDAETLIGRHLPAGHNLRIVTKLPPLGEISSTGKQPLLDAVAKSLERLKVDRVYGLFAHHASDLARPGGEYVVEALQEALARGWAGRIGVSVYTAEQIELAQSRFQPMIVQVPLNALDRRLLASGWLARLKRSGIEIHARSAFLQGLLLMQPADLPDFFAGVRGRIADLRAKWSAAGVSALAGCLTFVLQQPEIDAVIVGVNRVVEFDEIEAAVRKVAGNRIEMEPASPVDPIYLDPSRWPSFVH
jgi:aryl-alcohol dehydrogenase-like predicted oxidoreductase